MDQVGEEAAVKKDWFHRWILLGMFPYPRRMSKMLLPARFAQRLGLLSLARALHLMPAKLRRLICDAAAAALAGTTLAGISAGGG